MRNRKITRWLTTAAVLLGIGFITPIATAGPAAASGYGCNGSLIDTINHTSSSGALVAKTFLYWDGTYNCAVAVKQGSYYGTSSRMDLSLGTPDKLVGDSGSYSYYAGPIRVYGVGKCIFTELTVYPAGGGREYFQDRNPYSGYFHCG
ncbi:hypothetical protein [Streptomyces sp. NPDC059744]|uniref:hypothetical protein n=1 Tax=Streptomyces sp. NPDC059744 TaxID=3346929 RepID=UPI0036592BF4